MTGKLIERIIKEKYELEGEGKDGNEVILGEDDVERIKRRDDLILTENEE